MTTSLFARCKYMTNLHKATEQRTEAFTEGTFLWSAREQFKLSWLLSQRSWWHQN